MSDEADPSKTITAGGADASVGSTRIRRLQVVHGESRGTLVVLDTLEERLIGREGHVPGPLGLIDGEVSRQHAAIRWDAAAQSWTVTDLGSRNGTFHQGDRCATAMLRDGSVIRVGTSVLLFEDVELPAFAKLEAELPTLAGPSLAMQRVRGEIRLVAPQAIPVLILGESGVGKELVAEELHRQSGRSGAFVPVNCGAISPELAESELFGHAAGAFTGAVKRSEGLFLAAQNGTLFLDEVGELPLELQPKLLRALARGEARPVGSSQTVQADVRIIAATHRDLSGAAQEGSFRDDLLARLMGWTIRVPPLRARRDDVLALARLFVSRPNRAGTLSADAAEALLLHDWRYNVRELEHALAVASVRAAGGVIRREHLPHELALRLRDRDFKGAVLPPPPAPLEALIPRDRPPTKEELTAVLERLGGNMAQVADFFGKDRRQVYRWAEKLGLEPEKFRSA